MSRFEDGTAVFLDSSRKSVGMGIVVARRYVVTCAHVVNTALGKAENFQEKPEKSVNVIFPYSTSARRTEPICGTVLGWHPVSELNKPLSSTISDIAVVHLEEDVPEDVKFADLCRNDPQVDNTFIVFRWTTDQPKGDEAHGKIGGKAADGTYTLRGEDFIGEYIEPGFSGSGCWDKHLLKTVGMVVTARKDQTKRIAHMIPSTDLRIAAQKVGPDTLHYESGPRVTGPVEDVSIAHLPKPGKHFVGRETELALLDSAWNDPQTNIVEFVAFGGFGKSALVANWLKQMMANDWGGATRVFGHSFYSQGSRETAQASADSFLTQALKFFGDEAPESGSPWDKGERLARLVRKQRTLLILDGVEPLQHPPTSGEAGLIRDPGLASLVGELASASKGLCVISTRARIQDIEWLEDSAVKLVNLDRLSCEEGASLLNQIGVQGSEEDKQTAVEEVCGHAFGLTLLGTYLVNALGAQISRRHGIGFADIEKQLNPESGQQPNHKRQVSSFRRIMERYELWLSGRITTKWENPAHKSTNQLSLEILRLVGLFDRPITAGEFAVIIKGDEKNCGAISGLTDSVSCTSIGTLNLAVSNLQKYGLITRHTSEPLTVDTPPYPAPENCRQVLDSHPLVREYFATRLRQLSDECNNSASHTEDAAASDDTTKVPLSSSNVVTKPACEAHRRLFSHLQRSAPEFPATLEHLLPLYHAVAHGCQAGDSTNAYQSVYLPRILRDYTFPFSLHKLGAYSTDLSVLSNLFEEQWERPLESLGDLKGGLLLLAGHILRSLNRFPEAISTFESGLKETISVGQWQYAAVICGNYAELLTAQGRIAKAIEKVEQGIELADRSSHRLWSVFNRTILSGDLWFAGYTDLARDCFRDAYRVESENTDPTLTTIFRDSLTRFRYCELCLDIIESSTFTQEDSETLSQANSSDLLVQLRKIQEILIDSLKTQIEGRHTLWAPALELVLLARTRIMEVSLNETNERESSNPLKSNLLRAQEEINKGVSMLRQAGVHHWLPCGLLVRSSLFRLFAKHNLTTDKDDTIACFTRAETDISEIERNYSSMGIWQIEAKLERSRLELARGKPKLVQEFLDEIRNLVQETEQPYKGHTSEWQEWRPPKYVGIIEPDQIVGYRRRNTEINHLQMMVNTSLRHN